MYYFCIVWHNNFKWVMDDTHIFMLKRLLHSHGIFIYLFILNYAHGYLFPVENFSFANFCFIAVSQKTEQRCLCHHVLPLRLWELHCINDIGLYPSFPSLLFSFTYILPISIADALKWLIHHGTSFNIVGTILQEMGMVQRMRTGWTNWSFLI